MNWSMLAAGWTGLLALTLTLGWLVHRRRDHYEQLFRDDHDVHRWLREHHDWHEIACIADDLDIHHDRVSDAVWRLHADNTVDATVIVAPDGTGRIMFRSNHNTRVTP